MKNNSNIYSDIFSAMYSYDDVQICIEQIETYLAGMYVVDGKPLEQHIRMTFLPHFANAILQHMNQHSVVIENPQQNKQYFHSLEETLKQAVKVELTLSIEPDHELLSEITQYLRDAIGQMNVVVKISINPSLLGGTEIVWNGKYHNYSLSQAIDAWFSGKVAASVNVPAAKQ